MKKVRELQKMTRDELFNYSRELQLELLSIKKKPNDYFIKRISGKQRVIWIPKDIVNAFKINQKTYYKIYMEPIE